MLPGIGKRALPSVAGLAQDIISGENVKESALKRLKTLGSDVADETLSQISSKFQKGSGRRRRRKLRRTSLINRFKTKVYKKKTRKRRRKIVSRKRKSNKKVKFNFLQ